MTSRPVRRFGIASLLVAALVGGIVLVAPTQAAGPKKFDATVPASIPAGAGSNVIIEVINKAANRIDFNGVRITIPAGLNIVGNVTATRPNGTTILPVAASNPPYLEFLDAAIPKDQKLIVTIPVVQACANATYPWEIDVRQSNNFNGTDNKFDPVYEPPKTTIVSGGGCANVHCEDLDGLACSTGVITSPSGNTANVTVNDGDGLEANLEASFGPGAIDCPYYLEVSDQLSFDLENLNAFNLSGKTKTVIVTVADTRPELWEYQICFQAPYAFPAIVLAGDTENSLDALWEAISLGQFAAEPVAGTSPQEYRGLLLPCNLQQGVPCIESRTDLGSTVKIVITTPAADPGLRF